MNIMPIDAGLGAEIQDLDISQSLDDKTIAAVGKGMAIAMNRCRLLPQAKAA